MRFKREKNINVFNRDVEIQTSYLYTRDDIYSAFISNKKQTEEINYFIRKHFPNKIKIIDIGCGDGKYTLELYEEFRPSFILGIDPTINAIKVAKGRVKDKQKHQIKFLIGNIYNIHEIIKKNQFDVAIVRGVLHHLYRPDIAINRMAKVVQSVVVLEPNGYNPILKLIEKISPYHRMHEEKSYWPPSLDEWFLKNNYKMINQNFFGIVPYFCPIILAKFLKYIESFFENIPIINKFYCGTNLILYQKKIT